MRDWRAYLRRNLPTAGLRGDAISEVVEELADHLGDVYEEARAGGASEAQAEAAALAEVGDWDDLAARIRRTRRAAASPAVERGLERAEERLRTRGGPGEAVAAVLLELRLAARRLARTPATAGAVILTLGVAIGATTAIYGVVKAVLLDPLPYDRSEDLVSIQSLAPGVSEDPLPQSLAVNAVYEDESRSFDAVGVWYTYMVSATGGDRPEEIRTVDLTDGAFRALGAGAALGRTFDAADIGTGTPYTVVLSHGYWQRRFGGNREVLGQTLELRGRAAKIIGVMPAGFRFLEVDPDIYLPLRHDRSRLTTSNFVYNGIGRLRPGVTIEGATAELTRLLPLVPERYPGGLTMEQLEAIGAAPQLRPMRDEILGDVAGVLWAVLGGVVIILLVACANVANLLLVRADHRLRDVAVQAAMGSSRARIRGQFLAESSIWRSRAAAWACCWRSRECAGYGARRRPSCLVSTR